MVDISSSFSERNWGLKDPQRSRIYVWTKLPVYIEIRRNCSQFLEGQLLIYES
jgi:hypothetical protein